MLTPLELDFGAVAVGSSGKGKRRGIKPLVHEAGSPVGWPKLVGVGGNWVSGAAREGGLANAGLETIEIEVNDGSGEEGQELADDQAADNGDTEGATQFGAYTLAKGQRESA